MDSNQSEPQFTRFLQQIQVETEKQKYQEQIVRLLSALRQYRLLSGLYDRALRIAEKNKFHWHQFYLALICDHRHSRASKILQHSILVANQDRFDEQTVVENMSLARLQIEHLGDMQIAESAALNAVRFTEGTWISGRCNLLLAMVYGIKAQNETHFESRRASMLESIKYYERAIQLDPHDCLAHLYCALEYSISRNLEAAKERCQVALDLSLENPFAIILMALIFTAKKDYKGALELVINALSNFPSHYGLLVLRLKLESKYGRVEEALQTSSSLIYFWRKNRSFELNSSAADNTEFNGTANGELASGQRVLGDLTSSSTMARQHLSSKEAMVPLTPLLTAPLGIPTTPSTHFANLTSSNTDSVPFPSNDNLSILGMNAVTSELGGPSSTDSLSILSSSSRSWISFSAFKAQADIWVELAQFFIELDRHQDVQACVEEACLIYPNSHQAHYLKGCLYLDKAEKSAHSDPPMSRRLKREAKNCLLGAISLFTGHTPSYVCLSRLYKSEGEMKMAEKMLRDLMVINPLNFQSWHELGCILAELERNDEALECFQTAAMLNANTPLIPFQVIPRLFNP